jgi:hypothetical protein
MRLIRFIIFLLGIFIIIFLLSLLLPSNVTITKSVDINASAAKVKDQIVDFEEWKNWYPAFKDKNISLIKNPATHHHLPSVTLEDKKGKSITLDIIDTSKQTIIINLQSSSSTEVNYQFILIPKINNQTQLTWNVNIKLGWLPWKKMEGILLDKFSGSQYENALNELKKAAETN